MLCGNALTCYRDHAWGILQKPIDNGHFIICVNTRYVALGGVLVYNIYFKETLTYPVRAIPEKLCGGAGMYVF